MLFEIIFAITISLLLFYLISNKRHRDYADPFDYWKKFNVPSPEKSIQKKYNWNEITRRKAFAYKYIEEYNMFPDEPFYGGYDGFNQVLTIRDNFELIEAVLVKDFDYFQRTRFCIYSDTVPVNRTEEIIFKSQSVIHGDKWKKVRSVFGPIFNSDKLELLIPSIKTSNAKLEKLLDLYANDSANMELKEVFGLYVMDVNVSCVFGVDSEVFEHGNLSPYIQHVKPFLRFDFFHVIRSILSAMTNITVKQILTKLGLGELVAYPNGKHFKYFIDIIEEAFKVRLKSKIKRTDMIDMMINAIRQNKTEEIKIETFDTNKNSLPDNKVLKRRKTSSELDTINSGDGICENDNQPKSILKRRKSHYDNPENTKQVENTPPDMLDYDYVIANAAIMLEAGYDVNAIIMSFAIYFLVLYPDHQRKIQDELDANDLDDKEILESLPYLDAVLNESLRLGCVFPVIERVCSKSYRLPNTNIIIEKNQMVKVNLSGLFNDEKYFPKPQIFNPEHFLDKDPRHQNPFRFIPFSAGPRNCPAYKYAILEMKMCLAHIIGKFDFYPCHKTNSNFEIDNVNYLGGIKGGFWVKCKRRN